LPELVSGTLNTQYSSVFRNTLSHAWIDNAILLAAAITVNGLTLTSQSLTGKAFTDTSGALYTLASEGFTFTHTYDFVVNNPSLNYNIGDGIVTLEGKPVLTEDGTSCLTDFATYSPNLQLTTIVDPV